MGNTLAPPRETKAAKLQNILVLLRTQQLRIRNTRQRVLNKQRRSELKMQHIMSRKPISTHRPHKNSDECRQIAEDIQLARKTIDDLCQCSSTIREIESNIKHILNSYYTYKTLQVVNTAIKQANATICTRLDTESGMHSIIQEIETSNILRTKTEQNLKNMHEASNIKAQDGSEESNIENIIGEFKELNIYKQKSHIEEQRERLKFIEDRLGQTAP